VCFKGKANIAAQASTFFALTNLRMAVQRSRLVVSAAK
jgi:hypothetical protein